MGGVRSLTENSVIFFFNPPLIPIQNATKTCDFRSIFRLKGAVKYCLVRRTTADSAFLLASTNVHTESQPIGMQNQLLSFSLDNT